MNEELAKLLKEKTEPNDPEIMKLVLLLANKAMDLKGKFDDDGALMVRDVNF